MKKLIIAEKPSVARNIADAINAKGRKDGFIEGNEYVITWAFGHLLQLYDMVDYDLSLKGWRLENFPYIPQAFKYKVKASGINKHEVDSGAQKQINIINDLMARADIEGIIAATDDDREGQLIFDEIAMYLKTPKPIERLLLNEWTTDEVLKGLKNLRPNTDMQSLQDAGIGRQLADWLIGINLTSVATVKYRDDEKIKVLNIGRVLLPTLKIIYDRDKEIENFQESKYYKLVAEFNNMTNASFEGIYQEEDSEKFEDQGYLTSIAKDLNGKNAVVISKKVEQKNEYPPYLFNLSNLQGFITSKFKNWTSDKVLKTAQSLYEKKAITYPRTASQVLDESLIERVEKVLNTHKQGNPFADEIAFHTNKRVFDSKKVESHSAIIPTYMIPKSLTAEENVVYDAIKNRFLAQFMPVAESEETVLDIQISDRMLKGIFISKGKVQLVEGWKKIEKITAKEVILPMIEENEQLVVKNSSVAEVKRKAPKAHNEKTLLRVMETCGKSYEEEDSDEMMLAILSGFSIGTPATRAETIKKLKDVGYITTKGKSLVCTDLGKMLVETFPVQDLFDLEYTGKLEKTLADIEKHKFHKNDFINIIEEFIKKSVNDIKNDPKFGAKSTVASDVEVLGQCPECGSPVVQSLKTFGCSNWKNGCKFAIWKDDRYITAFGKSVSPEMIKLLLKNGRVGFRGLISKKGNKFAAYFYYKKDENTGRYNWSMEFIDNMK
ncbi:MAG: type IA DNA topoisomerase [Pelosinus sp.]|nr:type IA DNA topoisomerase [Pelosinus sp.]